MKKVESETGSAFSSGRLFWNKREDRVWHLTNHLVDVDTRTNIYRLACATHTEYRYVYEEDLEGEVSEYATLPVWVHPGDKPRRWGLRDIAEAHKERLRDDEDGGSS